MHIFVNEGSFHGQFETRQQFQAAMTRFLGLVEAARGALVRNGGRMWRSEQLKFASALSGETLQQSLYHVSGKELMESFMTVVYDRANPAPWEPERLHDDNALYLLPLSPPAKEGDVSLVEGETVNNTSVAELAERRLRTPDLAGGLIGLEQSRYFAAAAVHVLKVEHARVVLCSWCKVTDLKEWLRRNVLEIPAYTPEATEPPRDEQTCLADRTVYAPTGRDYDGRKIYRHKTNRRYYYVDNLHWGAAAHLEVFDKYGRTHLGEASPDGRLDTSKADPAKKPIDV